MEKERLIHAYAAASSEHSRTVNLLKGRMGVMKQGEYKLTLQFADEAKSRAQQTRAALDAHVTEHGC